MNIVRFCVFVMLLCGAIRLDAAGKELSAGVARIEITPPVGYVMGGYGERKGASTDIHDPLFATVLVLQADGISVAIISCDLRSFPSARVVTQARERKLADHVLLAVTHNHSGPLTWEDQTWPSQDQSWFAATENKILSALESASKQMFPARIAAGFGEVYLGHNRRKVAADGKVTMLWRNAEKLPTSPLDPTLGVIRVDDATGKPRVIIVNYACHAVVLGPDNRTLSADYPGYLARRLEQEFPGALCLFTQGGAGDINPYLDKQPVAQNGFGEAEKMGNALAAAALSVVRRLKPATNDNAQLQAAAEVRSFADRWDAQKSLRAGLTTLLINNQIAIATMPGEPFVGLQLLLKLRSPLSATFLCGYTNGYIGYFPTMRDAVAGGYGANTIVTRVEVGAGERMIDRGLIHTYRLLGKLKDKPEQP